MCKQWIYGVSFIFILNWILAGAAQAADPDLVGYWRCDEGSGTVAYDSSGNGNDGTFNGDPQWVEGYFSGALEFDQSGDFLDCGNDASLGISEAVTLTAWINLGAQGIDQKIGGNQDGANGGYKMGIYSNDKVEFEIRTSGNAAVLNRNSGGGTVMQVGTWYHIAGVYSQSDGTIRTYVNGVLDREAAATQVLGVSPGNFYIGCEPYNTGAYHFNGVMDDFRLYSRALTEPEINGVMMGGGAEYPYASSPSPADGALHADTWVTLSWRAGDFAASHDVYLSDTFDDVNDGTGDAFRGNQTSAFFVAGFPGFAYPDGLIPGTTYYWRIDEVNDADPNSPWRGPVWSFSVPSKKAYNPVPADGSNFVESADLILSWTPGFGAKLHTVYFGEDFDTVSNATGGVPGAFATYNPGPLELETTYYWRVDEFDGIATYPGDVWCFSTIPEISVTNPTLIGWWTFDEGTGTLALDGSGYGNHGELLGNPQWVAGQIGGALEFDGSGDVIDCGDDPSLAIVEAVTMTAWVKVAALGLDHKIGGNQDGANGGYKMTVFSNNKVEFEIRDAGNASSLNRDVAGGTTLETGAWYHVAGTYSQEDGTIRTYVNGVLDRPLQTASELGASPGNFYIGCEPFNTTGYNFTGVMDDVRLYSRALTPEEIKQTMRGELDVAWDPEPVNGSIVDIMEATPLTWSSGDKASEHDVYFSTDKDALEDTDASDTTGVYRGRQSGTSYTPSEGVEWGGGPYYWRIDEVNTDGTISKGRIWTFTVADFRIVDDFESYTDDNDAGEAIWQYWIDGFGVAGNGSQVGYLLPPYTERAIVHGGLQSMPLLYDNTDGVTNSEAELTLTSLRNWTAENVVELSLWFHGDPANATEPLYVAVSNIGGAPAVVTHEDPAAATVETWTQWIILLQTFADQGINLRNVDTIAIGLGSTSGASAGGSGTMYFDDIRLYRPGEALAP